MRFKVFAAVRIFYLLCTKHPKIKYKEVQFPFAQMG